MMPSDVGSRLQATCAAWPDPQRLRYSFALRERLARLPDEISGVSLAVLKDVALPTWRDGEIARLVERLARVQVPADVLTAGPVAQADPAAATGGRHGHGELL